MKKFFNKWTRRFHRWITVPTIIIIPLAVISKFSGGGSEHLPPQIEQLQSILMLLLVISVSYLYLIPYFTKWRRNRRIKVQQPAKESLEGKKSFHTRYHMKPTDKLADASNLPPTPGRRFWAKALPVFVYSTFFPALLFIIPKFFLDR